MYTYVTVRCQFHTFMFELKQKKEGRKPHLGLIVRDIYNRFDAPLGELLISEGYGGYAAGLNASLVVMEYVDLPYKWPVFPAKQSNPDGLGVSYRVEADSPVNYLSDLLIINGQSVCMSLGDIVSRKPGVVISKCHSLNSNGNGIACFEKKNEIIDCMVIGGQRKSCDSAGIYLSGPRPNSHSGADGSVVSGCTVIGSGSLKVKPWKGWTNWMNYGYFVDDGCSDVSLLNCYADNFSNGAGIIVNGGTNILCDNFFFGKRLKWHLRTLGAGNEIHFDRTNLNPDLIYRQGKTKVYIKGIEV